MIQINCQELKFSNTIIHAITEHPKSFFNPFKFSSKGNYRIKHTDMTG